MKFFKYAYLSLVLTLGVCVFLPSTISAQAFRGSNISNYYCPAVGSDPVALRLQTVRTDAGDDYVCVDSTGRIVMKAVPRPPQLREVEVWFVRLIYVAWAVSGVLFTIGLIQIGFIYLTSFGNEVATADAIKKLRKWIIGIAIVFLTYPALNTLFNVLPLSNSNCYNDINVPGFQFFFPDACVAS